MKIWISCLYAMLCTPTIHHQNTINTVQTINCEIIFYWHGILFYLLFLPSKIAKADDTGSLACNLHPDNSSQKSTYSLVPNLATIKLLYGNQKSVNVKKIIMCGNCMLRTNKCLVDYSYIHNSNNGRQKW